MVLKLPDKQLMNLSNPDLNKINVVFNNVIQMEATRVDLAVFTKIVSEGKVINIDQSMNKKYNNKGKSNYQ